MTALWQRLRDDLPALVLLSLMLVFTTLSVALAGWADGLRSITVVALVGLLTGYVLAISSFSEFAAGIVASVYGAFVVGLQQAMSLDVPLPLRERVLQLLERLVRWLAVVSDGGFSDDSLIFVFFLAILYWAVSFSTAWNMFRNLRLWRAVVPPGFALLINIYFYTGPARFEWLLLVYLFSALVLAAHTNALARESWWVGQRMPVSPGIRLRFVRSGLLAGVALLGMSWFVPTGPTSQRLAQIWDEQIEPRVDIETLWDRMFSVETLNSTSAATDYYSGQTLTLGGAVNLGNGPVMNVQAPPGPRYYWRSKVFTNFNGRTWSTLSDGRVDSEFGVLYYEDATYQLRRNVRQRVEFLNTSTGLIYTAPQPSSVGIPVSFDVLYIDQAQERGTLTVIRAGEPLEKGDSYETISSVSYADEASLRLDSSQYPGWVQFNYLQTPELTSRTVELAEILTGPYSNAYDKARSIESWLRENINYNEAVTSPPPEADPVDYVLFERREGYCTYYASAMVMLLRSQGIPARLASGFAQGAYDDEAGTFHVIESDAHTWVEVYFADYGWVEFEPTAAQSAISARGEVVAQEDGGPLEPIVPTPQFPEEEALLPTPESEVALPDGSTAATGSGWLRFTIPPFVLWALALLGVSVGLGSYLAAREADRLGLRGVSRVTRAYGLVNLLGVWMGLRPPDSQTPNERLSRLSRDVPEAANSLQQIAGLYVRERFAPSQPDNVIRQANVRAGAAWNKARPLLLRQIFRRVFKKKT